MDTNTALIELQRVTSQLRAAENLEEVLKVAVAAESRQGELIRGIDKLSTQREKAINALEEIHATLETAKKNQKEVLNHLAADEKAVRDQVQKAEEAARQATENLKAGYKAKYEDLDQDFKEKRTTNEIVLEDLRDKIEAAKALLQSTREKFREIA